MIQRATDAGFINHVVNHPSVRPYMHAPAGQQIDLTQVVANPHNLVLVGQFGGMVFVQQVNGVYEVHTQVLPEGRGEWSIEMVQACGDWLFSKTNATEVFTRCPSGNVAAKALAHAVGMRPEQKVMQQLPDGEFEVEIYGGRLQDWIRTAPGLTDRGEWFHEMLETKAKIAGVNIDHHPQDSWHDRHVGAAVGMFLGGQALKGVLVFNRWAAMAMAPPIKIVNADPIIIDITSCFIEIHGNTFEVLPCPQA